MFNTDKSTIEHFSNLSAIASLILSIISVIVLGYIAFKTMQYTAKPNLKVKILKDWLYNSQITTLKFIFINRGHWYAKPGIVIDELYINFDNKFDLSSAKYGSALERDLSKDDCRLGKKDAEGLNCKYFQFADIHLFYGEPNEEIHIELKAPKKPGIYKCWVSARAKDSFLKVHAFRLKVL